MFLAMASARLRSLWAASEKVFVCTGVYPLVTEIRSEAEDLAAMIKALPKEVDSLSLLSEILNFSLVKQPIDEPSTAGQMKSWTEVQSMRDHMRQGLGNRCRSHAISSILPNAGPSMIILALLAALEGALETRLPGFVIAASHVPAAYEDVAC